MPFRRNIHLQHLNPKSRFFTYLICFIVYLLRFSFYSTGGQAFARLNRKLCLRRGLTVSFFALRGLKIAW
jgi:hypothetical protein